MVEWFYLHYSGHSTPAIKLQRLAKIIKCSMLKLLHKISKGTSSNFRHSFSIVFMDPLTFRWLCTYTKKETNAMFVVSLKMVSSHDGSRRFAFSWRRYIVRHFQNNISKPRMDVVVLWITFDEGMVLKENTTNSI